MFSDNFVKQKQIVPTGHTTVLCGQIHRVPNLINTDKSLLTKKHFEQVIIIHIFSILPR